MVGSGRSELMRALFGIARRNGGEVELDGRPIDLRNPTEALRAGIFMLPEDRKVEGIFPDLDVEENLVATRARVDESALRRALIDSGAELSAYLRVQDLRGPRTFAKAAHHDAVRRQSAEGDAGSGTSE